MKKYNVSVVEKCERKESHAPKWEIYCEGEHVTTVNFPEYVQANISYYERNGK